MAKKTEAFVDYFEYVRAGILALPGNERVRLAVDAEISPRTLEYIAKQGRDAKYSTVMRLYRALREREVATRKT